MTLFSYESLPNYANEPKKFRRLPKQYFSLAGIEIAPLGKISVFLSEGKPPGNFGVHGDFPVIFGDFLMKLVYTNFTRGELLALILTTPQFTTCINK